MYLGPIAVLIFTSGIIFVMTWVGVTISRYGMSLRNDTDGELSINSLNNSNTTFNGSVFHGTLELLDATVKQPRAFTNKSEF